MNTEHVQITCLNWQSHIIEQTTDYIEYFLSIHLLYLCQKNAFLVRCLQVSNLFARDELDEITQELISVMKKEFPRRPPTNDNLYDYFISRARNNLHIVLCFSPVSVMWLVVFWTTF